MDQQIERRITSKTARNQGKTGEDGKARDAGLTPCLFVRVICRKHGEMRIAITEASEHCPKCSEPAYYLRSRERRNTAGERNVFENARKRPTTVLLSAVHVNVRV